jgi:uncharacterized protein YjbI with pentapeptide repeats
MANEEHVAKTMWIARLKRAVWINLFRAVRIFFPGLEKFAVSCRPNLSKAQLAGAGLAGADLSRANLVEANLVMAYLGGADLRGAILVKALLASAHLDYADLSGADLRGASLYEADLTKANFSKANLSGADLRGANLSWANLRGANLRGADLQRATLIDTDLTEADLTGCRVHGVSAWGLQLEGAEQQNLIITSPKFVVPSANEPKITVDNIEVAQFIYLMLHNQKIRDVINTITSKAVLILGRFTDERKAVLDALREELRNHNLLPIMFDFTPSASRDVTETIRTLAGLARFVIADVTDALEVRVELNTIVDTFAFLPIQPILLRGHPEFFSFLSHLKRFSSVLPIFEYDHLEHLLASLDKSIIAPAEAKAKAIEEALKEGQRKAVAELTKSQ